MDAGEAVAGGLPDQSPEPVQPAAHPVPHTSEFAWPGMRSYYATLTPHEGETRTGPGQIGVAFSAHREVSYVSGGRHQRATYPGGSVICSGSDEIVWSDVRDPTEALEIYPEPELLRSLGAPDSDWPWPIQRAAVGLADPVVLSIAARLRQAHTTGRYVGETAASSLAHVLARHVLARYAGIKPDVSRPTRLSLAALVRVHDLIEDDLAGPLTLPELSAAAHLSPFHFARCFTATTGEPPHRYVTGRRIDRARHLLRTTGQPVDAVAQAVGFSNISHFRRVFHAHVGIGPGAYRQATAPVPVAG